MISIVMVFVFATPNMQSLYELTLRSLYSLLKTATMDYELILIDNGSYDPIFAEQFRRESALWGESYGFIKGTRILRFDEPVALSKAWNTGIHQSDGEYILIANNDIVYHEKGWMDKLVEPFNDENRKIGIVGIQHMSWYKFAFVEGSLFMFKSSLIDEVDERENPEVSDYPLVFDERFFISCEDVDFNRRVQDLGYETIQVNTPPLQPVWLQHIGHQTSQAKDLAITAGEVEDLTYNQESHRSRILLCEKYGYDSQIID